MGWRSAWAELKRRSGRRGAALTLFAAIDFGYGSGLAAGYVPAFADQLTPQLPLTAWGWAWIAVGVVCLTGVPLSRDQFQYAAAALMKAAWATFITVAWIHRSIPGGWTAAVAWAGIAALVVLISGWPEARDP